MKRGAWIVLTLGLAGGCSDYDPKGWLVDRTRVIGARTEASADPTRASLEPGERASVTWLVVNPASTPRLAWAFAACAPPGGNYAASRCDGAVLASGSGTSDGELATMAFDTPSLAATGDAKELLLLAAFCEGGAPALDARAFAATCAGGGAALLAATRVRLAAAGPNRNPAIGADTIRLGDQPLPEARFSISSGACTGTPDAPVVQAGAKVKLHYRFDDREREVAPDAPGGREGLLLSHLVTSGELERQYSSLDPGEPASKDVSVELSAPGAEAVGADGRLIRLFFVLRDDRGATGFAVRSVCVRP
ncbi:MAG: hypothetical protein KF764_33440 [Labilithrix sp.]|nr:hypothetical protein [Labilithrix sp.]